MSWVSPTGYNDPGSNWQGETNAYDENTSTYAEATCDPESSTGYLELTHPAINCDKIRFWVNTIDASEGVSVQVYYEGGWHDVAYNYAAGQWVEAIIIPPATKSVTKMRFSFSSDDEEEGGGGQVHEADFNQITAGNPWWYYLRNKMRRAN